MKYFFGLLFLFLAVLPGLADAARKAPGSATGVVPFQAPLQPIPEGAGPNLSNNIVQDSTSGAPDSAAAVPDATTSSENSIHNLPQATVQHSSSNNAERSSNKGFIVVIILILLGVLGYVYARGKHSSV